MKNQKLFNNLVYIISNFKINLEEKDILNFLKIEKRWPYRYPWGQPSIEIISNLGEMRSDYLFKANGYLDYKKWYEMYELGYTTIISNVLDLTEELRNIKENIKINIGSEINGNFYFSKPGQKPSFDEHTHNYDVIVKQIYGKTFWKLNGEQFILNPQESFWIQKEAKHEVISKEEKKLSLTLNVT